MLFDNVSTVDVYVCRVFYIRENHNEFQILYIFFKSTCKVGQSKHNTHNSLGLQGSVGDLKCIFFTFKTYPNILWYGCRNWNYFPDKHTHGQQMEGQTDIDIEIAILIWRAQNNPFFWPLNFRGVFNMRGRTFTLRKNVFLLLLNPATHIISQIMPKIAY